MKITFSRVPGKDDRTVKVDGKAVGRIEKFGSKQWCLVEVKGSIANINAPSLRKLKMRLYTLSAFLF